MTRLLPLLALVMATLLAAELAAGSTALAKPEVTDARLGAHADKTRFVLDLDERPAYRAFTLPDPFRVVIDLPALDWTLGPDEMPRSAGLVDKLRFGLARWCSCCTDGRSPGILGAISSRPWLGQDFVPWRRTCAAMVRVTLRKPLRRTTSST